MVGQGVMDEGSKVYLKHKKYLDKIASSYKIRGRSFEEIQSLCSSVWFEYLKTYSGNDLKYLRSISPLITKRIYTEMMRSYRPIEKALWNAVPIHNAGRTNKNGDEVEPQLSDFNTTLRQISSPQTSEEIVSFEEAYYILWKSLGETARYILGMLCDGYSTREIGKKMNCSTNDVFKVVKGEIRPKAARILRYKCE